MGIFQEMGILTEEEANRNAEQWKRHCRRMKSTFFIMGLFSGMSFILLIVAYASFA